MEYNAQNIEAAVRQFYCDASLQQEVHRWLTVAQLSPQAWTFSWELLTPQHSVEVQFFGASCLHVKISRYWAELQPDQYEALRNQLFQKIIDFMQGAKIVRTRLCIAMSSLALHSMPELWPHPVQDMTAMFQRQESFPNVDATQLCQVLLELLTVLPEEFFTMNLARHRRAVIRNELSREIKNVLQLLRGLMSPTSPVTVYEQSLLCFSSWVEFGVPLIEGEEVILQVFQTLSIESLFDSAVNSLADVFSHADSQRYPYTVQKLIPQVLQLHEKFQQCVREEDNEACHGITKLVVSVAENHSKLVVEGVLGDDAHVKDNSLNLIHMVLACTAIPGHFPTDEMSSDLSFTFWYILQDDIVALEPEKYRQILPVVHPIYLRLIEVLLVKVQFPEDAEYQSWSKEEEEQFRCYRQDIGDTMMYSFNILREPVLGHMCNMLVNIVESTSGHVKWQMIEAIFFLFGSVAENVKPEENMYIPLLLQMLPRIPFNNIKLISTALYMIGSFGEWMNSHPDNLAYVIPLLLEQLGILNGMKLVYDSPG